MSPRRFLLLTVAFSLIILETACTGPIGVSPSPSVTPFPTIIEVTATPSNLGATATPGLPAATPFATATAQPGGISTTSVPQATRVNFAPGDTFNGQTGNLPARGSVTYVLNVMANQLMEVSFENANPPQIAITGADGTLLKKGMSSDGSFFRGTVPVTQDYYLTVTAGAQAVAYTMNVVIPQRVTFAQGATQAVVQDHVAARSRFYYVIALQAGQMLDIGPTPDQGLNLSIYGADGNVLKSPIGGGTAFRGTVPATEDYILDLAAGDQAVDFNLNIAVPQRISFAPGATSATLSGDLASHNGHDFIIRLQGGQQLVVDFTPAGSAKMSIYGVDGNVLWSGMGEGTHFTGSVPSTQDYFIVFQAGDQPVHFQLTVTAK